MIFTMPAAVAPEGAMRLGYLIRLAELWRAVYPAPVMLFIDYLREPTCWSPIGGTALRAGSFAATWYYVRAKEQPIIANTKIAELAAQSAQQAVDMLAGLRE